MTWISVEDRLPEEQVNVLVCTTDVVTCMYVAEYTGSGWIFGWDDTLRGVTHWMPLPEAPGTLITI